MTIGQFSIIMAAIGIAPHLPAWLSIWAGLVWLVIAFFQAAGDP